VDYDELPKTLINAVVAIEDKTFWTHRGFNITRMIGAVRESYFSGAEIQGTSTLSQQLARNIWLEEEKSEYSFMRTIKEAFYARQIERELTKEEIITAYMNTIPLGNHSYGVKAAANQYFGKELNELDLLECASLAALPSSPSTLSMITTIGSTEYTVGDPNILLITNQYTFLYNNAAVPRIRLVLDLMLEQGYITQTAHDKAYRDNIRYHLHPQALQTDSNAAMFSDWLIEDVAEDLLREYPDRYADLDEALHGVYSGGFEIHSTFNQRMQDIATEEFENPKNYPVAYLRKDRYGNCLDQYGEILLYAYANLFVTEEDGQTYFRLKGGETDPDFVMNPNGSMTVFARKALGIYDTVSAAGPEITVEFKDFFTQPPGTFYITKGGVLEIPAQYKGKDGEGNLIVSADFFRSEDNFFELDEKGNYLISPEHFTLRQSVVQPQGAMVILDHTNGQVKTMVGGRGIIGAMQYNRALSPRQPGSTMKPLGTYGPALEMSAQGLPALNDETNSFGEFWSPLSVILDEPLEYRGRVWPKNWYGGYRGPQTLRKAVEQSINVCAVRVQLSVGNRRSVEFLKKLGITTVIEDGTTIGLDSSFNDLNPAALALGGMTQGLKPLESASAYGTFANGGVHVDPISYTLITDREGNIVLDGTPQKTQAMDPGTAYIMNDILRTTVSNGISSRGGVKGVPVAGKTGTTSENLDAWFVGNTPVYSAAVWIGNDVSFQMSQGSAAAAALFSKVMTRVYEGLEPGEYPAQPYNIVSSSVGGMSDIFFDGRVPSALTYGMKICAESGFLATPWCPETTYANYGFLNSTSSYDPNNPDAAGTGVPVWYCGIHNEDPAKYPIDPTPPPPPPPPNCNGNCGCGADGTPGDCGMPNCTCTAPPPPPPPVTPPVVTPPCSDHCGCGDDGTPGDCGMPDCDCTAPTPPTPPDCNDSCGCGDDGSPGDCGMPDCDCQVPPPPPPPGGP
jgi:penicillin-binding protein 1A